MLQESIISTAVQKALAFFCARPDSRFHERDVARRVGISPSATHTALRRLVDDGALSSERKGNMVFYRLEEERPLVRQYKTLALVASLEPLILELRGLVDRLVLFGSGATGEYLEDSDVDLLVVTSHPGEAGDRLFRFARDYERELRPVVVTLDEWMAYETRDPAFVREVQKGLTLYRRDSRE